MLIPFLRGLRGAPEIASRMDEPPVGDGWTKWIGGAVFPVLIAAPGYVFWATGAVATCIVLVSVGLLLHFHYFWGLHPKLVALSAFAKNVAAFGALCGIAYGVYKYLVKW